MARLAGMTLRERWGDWDRQAFTSESGKHISVWERTALSSPRVPQADLPSRTSNREEA